MKRFLSIVLVFVFLLTFSACRNGNNDSVVTTTSSVPSETELSNASSNSSVTQTISPSYDTTPKTSKIETTGSSQPAIDHTASYKALDCRAVYSWEWQAVQIKHNGSAMGLQLEMPSDWYLSNSAANTLDITRSGKKKSG